MISLGCRHILIYTWSTITFYISLALINVLGWCSGGPHENNTIKLWSGPHENNTIKLWLVNKIDILVHFTYLRSN